MPASWPPSVANLPGPYVIGATGGSGTRVFARIVRHAAMFVGTHLNVSDDSLFFGDYSDRWIDSLMNAAGSPSNHLHTAMVRDLATTVGQHLSPLLAEPRDARWRAWGWKEPRSLFLLPFLHGQFPELKFVHVIRDGRDMAYSTNQNQLRKHGHTLLTPEESTWAPPLRSMALWTRLNIQRADYGETHLRDRYLRLRFEDLCRAPHPTIARMLHFLGLQADIEDVARLEVSPPPTLGRWQTQASMQIAELHRIGHVALERFGYLTAEGQRRSSVAMRPPSETGS